ncbi:MAG: molecular chaperone TorD family protein [Gammaproteobacteria bacterium]|nr:molecular chaperone TorD family protein [Gammaproteobacteria bacterium]
MLDALSLAVDYPSTELIDAWRTGHFLGVIESALAQAGDTGDMPRAFVEQAFAELAAAMQAYMTDERTAVEVQADYVALFELNRERPPVHLLQHLYDLQMAATQLDLYRQLAERYRSFGIALKQGEGARPPDQLSVQLEFIAYLYGRLAKTPTGEDAERLCQTLHDFAGTLQWIDAPIQRLAHADIQHPFYLPLLRFVRHALDLCHTTVGDVD